MSNPRKIQELADKLIDGSDTDDLVKEAITIYHKCRLRGEDQNNAIEYVVEQLIDGLDAGQIQDIEDALRSELEDAVIGMKDFLEKIREQVQNIE